MENSFMQRLKQKVLEADRSRAEIQRLKPIDETDYFRGYSLEDVDAVMMAQQVDFLPEVYREFLLAMGHAAGNALIGAHLLRPDKFKNSLKFLVTTQNCSNNFQLPDDDIFVFAASYENYWFFRTCEKQNDPPVYIYHECYNRALQVAPTLSEWFLTQALYRPDDWVRDHMLSEIIDAWSHLPDETDDVPF